jgi:hypothetical protein
VKTPRERIAEENFLHPIAIQVPERRAGRPDPWAATEAREHASIDARAQAHLAERRFSDREILRAVGVRVPDAHNGATAPRAFKFALGGVVLGSPPPHALMQSASGSRESERGLRMVAEIATTRARGGAKPRTRRRRLREATIEGVSTRVARYPASRISPAVAGSWLAVALAALSCRATDAKSSPRPATRVAAPPVRAESVLEPAPPPEWSRHARVESNAGSYVVHVAPAPGELPDNEDFELRVWVSSAAAPNEVASGVKLAVDASMPEHGHGMNRTPRIERAPGGEFVVQGMLFHMTGRWELYFDITAGALTERAQVDVILE